MKKIIINTRDSLVVINPDLVAAVQADGNYSHVVYLNKHRITTTLSISKIEQLLKQHSGKNIFIRIGRSVIINHSMLYSIEPLKQQIELSRDGANRLRIYVSKKMLKAYKQAVVKDIENRQLQHSDNVTIKKD